MSITGRIMVIDDNENLRKTMERVLSRKGHDVVTAGTSTEALQIAEAHHDLDLVFMDVKMPLRNGFETHRQLMSINPNSVIILMTANTVEDIVKESLRENFHSVLNQPFEIERIMQKIENARISEEGALVIVNADSTMRSSFKLILEQKDFSVAITSSSEEAIAVAKQNSFDILFIDDELSTTNGFETYNALKEILPDTVAVLVTGFPRNVREIVKEAMMVSSFSCLHKPLDMVQVFAIVDEILSKLRGIA